MSYQPSFVTREEFLAHIAALFDGTKTEPATYAYGSEVTTRQGVVIDDQSFECFEVESNPPDYTYPRTITVTHPGSQATQFPPNKEQTLESLRSFFDKVQPTQYIIGEKRKMSLFAYLP